VLLDEASLRVELERNHADSFGWSLSCCGRRREEAEDVLQIAYLKVLTGKAVFEGRSTFKTWFFAVIRNTAASERRRGWFRRINGIFLAKEPSEPHRDPVSEDEASDRLRRILGKLPARQREVLDLVFYHDLSIAEAASVIGVGVGSARTHYERGKQEMRRQLEKP
jgi:RNA polymerase sigma-70 factor (ECF subfamily)